MSRANAFFDGMRTAFNLMPEQKIHKANFITESKTPKVDVNISSGESCSAWLTVGSYTKKAGKCYQLKQNNHS